MRAAPFACPVSPPPPALGRLRVPFVWTILALGLWSAAPAASAAINVTVGHPIVVNYSAPFYVIDSDAAVSNSAYNRDQIPVRVQALFQATSGSETGTFRAGFRLLDAETGQAVPLVGGDSNNRVFTFPVSITAFSFFPTQNTFERTVAPTALLDHQRQYRVEAVIQRQATNNIWTGAGQNTSSTDYTFVHFRGPRGSDAAVNVVAEAYTVQHQRRYLVETDPDSLEFTATVGFRLFRYDEPTLASLGPGPWPINVRFEVDLLKRDQTLTVVDVIPVANTFVVADPVPSIAPHIKFGTAPFERPATSNYTRTIRFRPPPGVQLDTVNFDYAVRVRVAHMETPPLPIYTNANQLRSNFAGLLQFNGSLLFGNVPTTMKSVTTVNTGSATYHPTHVRAPVTFATNGGTVDQAPDHIYGPGTVTVRLLPNGDAIADTGTIEVRAPTPSTFLNGIEYSRGVMTLGTFGARATDFDVRFPAGLGWAETASERDQRDSVRFNGPHALTPSLRPEQNEYAYYPAEQATEMWVAEESKPAVLRTDRVIWQVAAGRLVLSGAGPDRARYVRARQHALLAAAPSGVQRIKRSNTDYWRHLAGASDDATVRASSTNGALLTIDFHFNSGSPTTGAVTRPHFPTQALLRITQGTMRVVDDLVVPADSYLNTSTVFNSVTVPYSADCQEPDCGNTSNAVGLLNADNQRLRFTTDGGLVGAGNLSSPLTLRWGWIAELGRHAHRTDAFGRASFHQPGHFLRGGVSLFANKSRHPAEILLSGADPATGIVTERASHPFFYRLGQADYAGLNLRVSGSGGPAVFRGESTLGGGVYGPYELKSRSKYYLRLSGISGIHDKVPTGPEKVLINGYDFTFLNFGLAFLSNVNVDSRTEGDLTFPYPTDDRIDFERLLFLCNGALDKATVKNGPQTIVAKYWGAEIDVSSIEFKRDPTDLCSPGKGSLALGVTAYMAHVTDSFQGLLGIFPNGNFIPKGGYPADLDSRLIGPSQVRIRGPRRAAGGASGFETYVVTPTQGAFFNTLGNAPNYTHPAGNLPAPLTQGFINLPGLVRVSFFEALEAHLQTASVRPPEDPGEITDWGTAELFVANGAWGSGSYFKQAYHDNDNRGFPGSNASALTHYRTHPSHFVRARQQWLGGAIDFNFPVQWNSFTRSFRSAQPVKDEFVVIEVEQRVAYLSAEHAEVRFGAQVGLPQLNLANFVLNTVSDATGIAATVNNALGHAVTAPLHQGLVRLDDLLADRMKNHHERLFGTQLDSFVNQLYNHLSSKWTGSGWEGAAVPDLDPFFGTTNVTSRQLYTQVWTRLGASTVSAEIQSSLNVAIAALDAFTGPTGPLPAGGSSVPTQKVLELTRALVKELAGQINSNLAAVVGGLATSQLDALINPHLQSSAPSLTAVRDALLEMRGALVTVRNRLNSGGEFRADLNALFQNFVSSEVANVHGKIRSDAQNYLNTFNSTNRFHQASPALVRQKLRNIVADRFYATSYAANVQVSVKQRVFDLNGALRSALTSSFSQVNEVVRGALNSAFLELDNSFVSMLGFIGPSMAAASLDGYALFNGDALRQVRMDAKFQWSVPEKTTFSAFLEINQYESGSDLSSCGPLGKDSAEVILGAKNVPIDFLSPNLRVDIGTKFSFDIQANGRLKPVGFAGSLKKTAGEVAFEAFSITDLAVAVAFGERENYLSAALGLRFNGYKAKGGIFFGRTCTLAPIMLWDMFVASALGAPQPTFTGAYVYGEAHIPVSEVLLGIPASCFFQVSAGMGLGVFYFIEGPTYGARGMLSVSGDALCILSLGGQLDFAGLKQGSSFKLKAKGRVYVEIGVCPLCIEASRSVTLETETGGGKAKGKKPDVK
jgi:hypothetical protein